MLPNRDSARTLYRGHFIELYHDLELRRVKINSDNLRSDYLENNKSISQLAKELGCARSTVKSHLEKLNVPLRLCPHWEWRKGQIAYGKRFAKNKEIRHQQELNTIARMSELRKQGYSFWKIAEILNVMKIPTKNKSSRWHATTVMKILNRVR